MIQNYNNILYKHFHIYIHHLSLPLSRSVILFNAEKRCNVANHHGNNINASTEATPAAKSLYVFGSHKTQAITENNTDNWNSANKVNQGSKSQRVLVIAPINDRMVAGNSKS